MKAGEAQGAELSQTVTVRIALAIDETGHWYASGWDGVTDKELMDETIMGLELEGSVCLYYIEASVEKPVIVTIQATKEVAIGFYPKEG